MPDKNPNLPSRPEYYQYRLLLSDGEELYDREELLAALWPDSTVSEGSLTSAPIRSSFRE